MMESHLKGNARFLVSVVLLGLLPWMTGCSLIPRIVSRAAYGYLDAGATVLLAQSDLAMAKASIPANLTLLETILSKTPEDRRLLPLAAKYQALYAYAFLEPELDQIAMTDPQAADELRGRASALYLRGREQGLRMLTSNRRFAKAVEGTPEELEAALSRMNRRYLDGLFWTAFCWGGYINLNQEVPEAVADSGRVQALMSRALELDETYFFGGPHLFFGVLLSELPPLAGGDAVASQRHFERALELTDGALLFTRVFYARYYAVRVQNRDLWRDQLQKVLDADLNRTPEIRLANGVAKDLASSYLEREDDFFFMESDEGR